MYDVIIIGGGIVGSCVAWELSKYNVKALLIEKEEELSKGASKANSGIVHSGYDCTPNTLKAQLNVLGNQLYEDLSKDLDFPFKRNGSLVLAFNDRDNQIIKDLYVQGIKNGVPNLTILSKEEALHIEPNLSENITSVLYAKSGGITSPYEATQAFAESAYENGVEFSLNTEVIFIEKIKTGFKIKTKKGEYKTKTIINCAGLYSDYINNMVSDIKYKIKPRKGEYMLFDNTTIGYIEKTIFQTPTDKGKGVLVTPTVHGNLMIGPSSEFIDDKENTKTHREVLSEVLGDSCKSVKEIPMRALITSFTGLRANEENHSDFIIEESKDAKGFINAIGINSPGLTSAPAIGIYIKDILSNILELEPKKDFIGKRKGIKFIRNMDIEEQNKIIQENKSYGRIVCRCEQTTEGEIIDAINRPLGAKTLDSVKRMTRSGMGKCQGGFCSSRILEILSHELKKDVTEITKSGGGSYIVE